MEKNLKYYTYFSIEFGKPHFYSLILICYFFFSKSSIVFAHFIYFSIVLCNGTVQINSNKVLTMFANSSILWKCHFRGYESCYRTETWKKNFQFTIRKLGRYAWWNFATKHFKICHKFWNTHFMLVWTFPPNKFLGPMIKLSSVHNHILSRPGQFIRGGKNVAQSEKWKKLCRFVSLKHFIKQKLYISEEFVVCLYGIMGLFSSIWHIPCNYLLRISNYSHNKYNMEIRSCLTYH